MTPRVPQEVLERTVALIPVTDGTTLGACALTCFFMLRVSRKSRFRVLHVKTTKKIQEGMLVLRTKIPSVSIPQYVEHLIIGSICGQIGLRATDPGIGTFLTAFENLEQITICASVVEIPPPFQIARPTILNLSTIEFRECDVVAWAEMFPNLVRLTLHNVASPQLPQSRSLPKSLRHLQLMANADWDDIDQANDGGVCAALCVDDPPHLESVGFLNVDYRDATRYTNVIGVIKASLKELVISIGRGDKQANSLLAKHEVLSDVKQMYYIDHRGRGRCTYPSMPMM